MAETKKLIASPEPVDHGTCTRIVLCPLSVISVAPAAAVLPPLILATPIRFCALFLCHIACCKCLCPESVESCAKNVVCTPCRWARISCTGKGHIMCCDGPAYPFNPETGSLC